MRLAVKERIQNQTTTLANLPEPQAGPQSIFLRECDDIDIVIYGGAAGGGKTFGLLVDAAKHVTVPGYGFVLFRRTSPQITNEGGMWDESQEIYPAIGGYGVKGPPCAWRFPSGAKGSFKHLEHEKTKYEWQGSQVAYIGFDELTHFSETQFFYMLSRNRSTCGVRPRVRATTNPAPGWVRDLLAPWLDPHHEWKSQSGEPRYFFRRQGKIIWSYPDELDAEGQSPKSITFVRATIEDNQKLLAKDPGYKANLLAQSEVDRERLYFGNWDVFDGSFFAEFSKDRHCIPPPYSPKSPYSSQSILPPHWVCSGALDWGFRDPFAFGLYAVDEQGALHCIETIQRAGLTNEAQVDVVLGILSKWGVDRKVCIIAYDPSMNGTRRAHMQPGYIGEADIEEYRRAGLRCAEADNNRQPGWSMVRKLLHTNAADGLPHLRLWDGYNVELVRQFPLAQFDGDTGEDMAEGSWDHLLDQLRYKAMTRPRPSVDPNAPPVVKPKPDRRDPEQRRRMDQKRKL